MRVQCIVLVTAVTLLASCNSAFAATDAERTKLAVTTGKTAGTSVSTYGGQNDGAENRILRAEGSTDPEPSAEEGESGGFLEDVKFYYWLKMGDTPAEVYQKFFKGVDRAIVLKNPNYEVWKRYKAYYEEETKSA